MACSARGGDAPVVVLKGEGQGVPLRQSWLGGGWGYPCPSSGWEGDGLGVYPCPDFGCVISNTVKLKLDAAHKEQFYVQKYDRSNRALVVRDKYLTYYGSKYSHEQI